MDVVIRCICPGTPHDGDTVTLRDGLDFLQASAIRNAVILLKAANPGADTPEVMAVLASQYLRHGIEAWTLVDAEEKPIPVTEATIVSVLMSDVVAAISVSDAADALYQEVMLPLLLTAFASSQPSPTASSTSRTSGSPRKRRKQSPPSSITTIPTADTARTSSSLDGDSSLSLSSA